MDIFFGRKTALSVSFHSSLPLCSLLWFQLCPCRGLVPLLWKNSQKTQNQQKPFKKRGFYPSSVSCLYSTRRAGHALPLGHLGTRGCRGLWGSRLAWLLCRCGDRRDLQSLRATAGPLSSPFVPPLTASPSLEGPGGVSYSQFRNCGCTKECAEFQGLVFPAVERSNNPKSPPGIPTQNEILNPVHSGLRRHLEQWRMMLW